MVRGFYFGLDVVVRLGWTGRGGMFLAPAVGAKEVYSVPVYPLHERGMHPVRHLKSLKNVQLTTQLC